MRGGIVGVVGVNGAGKTTLARTIGGLLPYHGARVGRGSVRLADPAASTRRLRDRARLVAQLWRASRCKRAVRRHWMIGHRT